MDSDPFTYFFKYSFSRNKPNVKTSDLSGHPVVVDDLKKTPETRHSVAPSLHPLYSSGHVPLGPTRSGSEILSDENTID